MKRVWIDRDELDAVKDLFRRELNGANTIHVPFERVLPLLKKPEVTRIIWCRSARQGFDRWGLKVGIRNAQRTYRVKVIDPIRWQKAINGFQFENDSAAPVDSYDIEHEELIPKPEPDYLMPDWADHLRQSLVDSEKILLVGATGCGKSTLIQQMAARLKKKFIRINLNGETTVADLVGGWRVCGREMVFQHGPIPKAMQIGAWLCLDELDAALPQICFCLQALLEDQGRLYIPETHEWITPHAEFRLIATANTLGKGDDSGLYAGTNVLNESFLDRFHSVFTVNYLPAEKEIALLSSMVKGLNLKLAERMVRVANDLRKALADGTVFSTFSSRKLLAWGRKSVQLGCPKIAATYAILNKIGGDDRRVVQEVLQRHGF